MAWCHQATSHYLSQCWPTSLSPYDITRPQWVKQLTSCTHGQCYRKGSCGATADPLKGYVMLDVICFNTLRPKQNGGNFADDPFKCIFFNETVGILIKISLKFVPKGPINNIPALVQIMACGANQATSHFLNQWWIVYWCIYASLGLNELILNVYIPWWSLNS